MATVELDGVLVELEPDPETLAMLADFAAREQERIEDFLAYVASLPPIEARVRKGVAWLDETTPGWRDAVVVAELELADPERCICGQVFQALVTAGSGIDHTGYGYARRLLGVEGTVEHGFAGAPTEWDPLQREWARVVREGILAATS